MLIAYRLSGLSALEAYYAGVSARAQFGPPQDSIAIKAAERRAFRQRGRRFLRHSPNGCARCAGRVSRSAM
jgi:hypothetical protein